MNKIQDKINAIESKIEASMPKEIQQVYVAKYLEGINQLLDECIEYSKDIKHATNFEYAATSAKNAIAYSAPKTLYQLYLKLHNVKDYTLLHECGDIFGDSANAIDSLHDISYHYISYSSPLPNGYGNEATILLSGLNNLVL